MLCAGIGTSVTEHLADDLNRHGVPASVYRTLSKRLEAVKRATRETEWQVEMLITLARGRAQALLHHTGGTGWAGGGRYANASILPAVEVDIFSQLLRQDSADGLIEFPAENVNTLSGSPSTSSQDAPQESRGQRSPHTIEPGSGTTLLPSPGLGDCNTWDLLPSKDSLGDMADSAQVPEYPEVGSSTSAHAAPDDVPPDASNPPLSTSLSRYSPLPSNIEEGGGAFVRPTSKRRKRSSEHASAVENGGVSALSPLCLSLSYAMCG